MFNEKTNPLSVVRDYIHESERHKQYREDSDRRTQEPEFLHPQIILARVLGYDAATGTCNLSPLGFAGQISAPILFPMASLSGTPHKDYDESYYSSRTKKYGNKKHEYETEGITFAPPLDSIAVVISSGMNMPGKSGFTFFGIVGFIGFSQYESMVGHPIYSANQESRLGDINKIGKSNERVKTHYKDYPDEVGYSEIERKKMAETFDPASTSPTDVVPLSSPDIYWKLKQASKRKETIGPTIFGIPITLFGGRYRFADRERLDAERISTKYDIEERVDTETIDEYTLETVLQFDKQGKILIGSDLKSTLVECYSSDQSDYESGHTDEGTFIAMGKAAQVNYVEISSRDWLLRRYKRGVERFDGHNSVHGHNHASAHRTIFVPQLISEPVDSEEIETAQAGTLYTETNKTVFTTGRFKVKAEGIQIDCPLTQIFIDGVSLFDILGGVNG